MTISSYSKRGDDIGGTWRDNTYPGCACDVQSHLYSFSFAPNPHWSRAFSPQPEIWAYLRDCARRYGVLPHIRWQHELREARWDDAARIWHIRTNGGDYEAAMLISGQGPLSDPALPGIPGIDRFVGKLFHSAQWDHTHDLHGERVAVIGTGASAIQFVPQIQPQVEQLVLFQRTPPWIVARRDHAIAPWQQVMYQHLPVTQRMVRTLIYLQREFGVLAFVYRPNMMQSFERLARKHLEAQVPDPELRARLTPNYTIGCKRILLSDDFYPALSQPNVALETQSIHEIRAHSVVTASGTEYPVDTIICATGFHVTDTPIGERIFGRDGVSLASAWQQGMQAYKGTSVAGFPNLFLLIGPNTGLGHTSMVVMIESQIAYLMDCLSTMDRLAVAALEVLPEFQATYNQDIQRRFKGTIWLSGCKSWYLDARGRNTTLWPDFTFKFRRQTRRFDSECYRSLAGVTEEMPYGGGKSGQVGQ